MNQIRKTVIINRAVPGSGKTTISNCITNCLKEHGLQVAIHSTDEFFMTAQGRYAFDIDKLHEYHQRNLQDFCHSLQQGVDVVICDNTNLAPWQSEPYTTAARRFGYNIVMISFTPRELEKHLAAQQVTPQKPDAHEVPLEVLQRFIEEYHSHQLLLESGSQQQLQLKHYVWDPVLKCKVLSGDNSVPFDFDHVLIIEPQHYRLIQNEIGELVLAHVQGRQQLPRASDAVVTP